MTSLRRRLERLEKRLPKQSPAPAVEDPQRPRIDPSLLLLETKIALLEAIRAKKAELGIESPVDRDAEVDIDLKLLPVEAKLDILQAIQDPEAARQRREAEEATRWERHCAKWGPTDRRRMTGVPYDLDPGRPSYRLGGWRMLGTSLPPKKTARKRTTPLPSFRPRCHL